MRNSKYLLKIQSFLKSKNGVLLLLILILGFFLRVFKAKELFSYQHDQDLLGWFIKDVVVNRDLRLIGQETSTQGIFIGPLYYYLQIPFYLLFGMDPIGGVVLIAILGMFTIWSFYFVLSKVFSKNVGLIAAFLYSVSFYGVFNDREIVPTMPVIVWSVWFFYSINLILEGEQKRGLLIIGILFGLIWHLNVALILLLPLVVATHFLSGKRVEIASLIRALIVLTVLSLPLFIFEIRNDFLQTRALYKAFTTDQYAIVSGIEKLKRVIHLASKNLSGFVWGDLSIISYESLAIIVFAIFAILAVKKKIEKKLSIAIFLWLFIYITFFSLYSKVLSEYYLNGMMVIWVVILALGITYLLEKKKTRKIAYIALILFFVINIYRFVSLPVNRSGYLERKAVVEYIKKDAAEHNYPCVAISYITDPGRDFGYRYFYWLEGLHANNPDSGSPVYTIVFPLKPIFPEDKTFGAIGLIYPDYSRYTEEKVEESCSGENSNLTDPMFGFVD